MKAVARLKHNTSCFIGFSFLPTAYKIIALIVKSISQQLFPIIHLRFVCVFMKFCIASAKGDIIAPSAAYTKQLQLGVTRLHILAIYIYMLFTVIISAGYITCLFIIPQIFYKTSNDPWLIKWLMIHQMIHDSSNDSRVIKCFMNTLNTHVCSKVMW